MEQYRDIKKNGYPELNTVVEVWIEENEMPFQAGWRDDGFGPCWHSENYEVQENKENIRYWRPIRLDRPGAVPSPAKAEQEGPWVKASDRLPEIANGVTKLKIDGKEAEGVWSATEQAFIVGGHRYPPTLYYIEWLDEKKRREQEGLRWVKASDIDIEDWHICRVAGTEKRFPVFFSTHVACDVAGKTYLKSDLECMTESTPPVKEAADPETAAKEASAILLNAMKAAGLNNHIRIIANHEGIDYQLSFERAKEAGQPRNLPIEELIKLSDEELNVEINKVRSRLGMGKSEEAGRSTEQLTIADYEQVLADNRRLVREIDVILNGDNAAKQASLCDLIPQIRELAQSRQQPPGDLSQMLKDYKGTIEYTKMLGGMDFEWSLEKLPVGKQETLYTLQGYKLMIRDLDAILYAYEEGARQWEERALSAEAKLKQPVGESAGVWVKATERLPELDKPICFRIYERRYAGKMTQEGIFSHDGYKCTYGVGSVEWLDESQNNKP